MHERAKLQSCLGNMGKTSDLLGRNVVFEKVSDAVYTKPYLEMNSAK